MKEGHSERACNTTEESDAAPGIISPLLFCRAKQETEEDTPAQP